MGNPLIAEYDVDRARLRAILAEWVENLGFQPGKTLIIPPDYTRCHSWAGPITAILYEKLSPLGRVDILPALGTHRPMTAEERRRMFGPGIPGERFIAHDWRRDLCVLGEIPESYVRGLSGGLFDAPVQVGINRRIVEGGYDRVVSVGQVVPHEVAGMANHNKNLLIGCGGKDMIDKSHFLGAVCGIERILGRTETPVRRLFDEADRNYLGSIPLYYVQTVTSVQPDEERLPALFIGSGRESFLAASQESRRINLTLLDQPVDKIVVYLDPDHFRSTWLGNKAIYRSRMAMADGGELVILGPGLERFGEDGEIDRLIRTYGYFGTPRTLQRVDEDRRLRGNLSAAAHLIHGSTEGRFRATYAPGRLDREEMEGVGFGYMPLPEAWRRYRPDLMKPGFNTLGNGERVYYIPNPALGLWALREQFDDEAKGVIDHE